MLTYETLKKNVRKFVSLTNLHQKISTIYCLPLGKPINKFFLLSKLDALRALPSTLSRRRQVQQMRKVSICNLYRAMIKDIFAPRRAARAKHIQNEKDTRSRRHL